MNTPSVPSRLRLKRSTSLILGAACLLAIQSEAAVFLWNVSSPGANNWNVNANWSPATGNPGSADTAIFGSIGTSPAANTINSVVSANTTVNTLQFTNTTSGQLHVVQIPTGVTLTVANNYTVGGMSTVDGLRTSAFMTGGGTLVVNAPTFIIGNQGSTQASLGTNDLSALSNFVYSASSATMLIGWNQGRSAGMMVLAAASNNVTAGTITQGAGGSSNGGNCDMQLGAGTNIINVGTHNVIQQKNNGSLRFATTTGGLRLRGVGGTDTDRATMTVGNRNATGTGTTTGNVSLNDHPVDMKLATLTVGSETANQSGVGAVGNFSFNLGTVDATTVNIANCSGNAIAASVGTMNVGAATGGNGTLIVGTSLSLANCSAGTNATGTLNIFGGAVIISNNLVKTTLTSSTGTVAVANGSLYVQGRMGTPTIAIDNFNITNATLLMNIDASGSITTNATVGTVNASGTTTFVISKVTGLIGPATFPLVAYSTLNGTVAGNFAVTIPSGYIGNLVDNPSQKRIDLSITPTVIITPLVWTGATNNDWDTTTTNWIAVGGGSTTFADAGYVIFDDTGLTNKVNLTAAIAPATMIMSNATVNYTFNGNGSLSGSNALTLKGAGTTILDNVGSNSFTGGINISAGTLQVGNNSTNGNLPDAIGVVDNSALVFNRTDSYTNTAPVSGGGSLTQAGSGTLVLVTANSHAGTTISAGTLQVGAGGTSGTLGSGTVTDNSALVFNRSDNVTVGNVINGTGSVTKNNNNTLTLSGNSGFSGGLTINSGMVRFSGSGSPGKGAVTVNAGGTAVFALIPTNNSIVLAGGTMGSSGALNPLTNDLTATASTTSIIYCADPLNLAATDGNEMAWSNTWHGAGNIIVASVTNDTSADSGNGFRLRGTTSSDFTGTLTFSNDVKGELQTYNTGAFSPIGAGKLAIVCGAYYGTNNTLAPGVGGYSELNLRNNSAGDNAFGNDLELLGNGLAVLNPLGTAPAAAKTTMGTLKIGGGQELGVYLSSGNTHNIVFPTVTLTGGTATFSPKIPGFGAASSVGSDLSLGNIGEISASGITMNGVRTLFLTGNNTYSGATTVNNGTLEVDGFNQGTGSVTVNNNATLTGAGGVAGAVSIAAGGTLAPGNAANTYAMLVISNSLALAGTNIMDVNKSGSVFLNDVITNITTVTYGGTLQLNLTGTALAAGDAIKLYGCSLGTGAFAAITPATPGTGLLWDTSTLTSGVLTVIPAVNTVSTNITTVVTGSTLALSWPADHTGWRLQVQTNGLATGLNTNWSDVSGSTTTNLINVTLDALNGAVFYRMVYP